MKICVRYILFSILFFTLSSPAFSQMKIYVSSTAQDTVGGRLAYAIKEGVRRSAGMSLADRDEDAFLSVGIVTLDPDSNTSSSNVRTIYSVVWTVKTLHSTPVDMYLTNSVGLCGASRVVECADGLVADTDAQATKVRGWLLNAADKPKQKR